MKGKEEVRQEILEVSKDLFFEKGYRKVTVDEIAAKLSISKKTIYKYYDSKQDILISTFEDWKKNISNEVNSVLDRSDITFIDKLKTMMTMIGVGMGRMNSILISDVQIHFPELWVRINNYKHEAAFLRFNRLIEEGIEKGHIKKTIDKNLVVALYACAIEKLLDPNFLNNLPDALRENLPVYHSEIFDRTLKIIYEGILTDDTIQDLNNG